MMGTGGEGGWIWIRTAEASLTTSKLSMGVACGLCGWHILVLVPVNVWSNSFIRSSCPQLFTAAMNSMLLWLNLNLLAIIVTPPPWHPPLSS